MTIYPTIMA
jgi:hypothetical protein